MEVRSFWKGGLPFSGGSPEALARLQTAFKRNFPTPLAEYITRVIPPASVCLQRVGNPVRFWAHSAVTPEPVGYRVDGSGKAIADWSPGWLIFADEGADPVIIDLDTATDGDCPVLQAMHGTGSWDFGRVADSIPQYLLLSAALHHALTMLPDPILDDDAGFRLAEPAASWLFPRVRGWAGAYYEDWVSIFHNS